MKKALLIIGIVLLVLALIVGAYFLFFGTKKCKNVSEPGVGAKCKCDQKGDDTSKFYGDNWKARGAVCDGLYIPKKASLQGKSPAMVLEKMSDLYAADNSLKSNMTNLADKAANQIT